MRIYLNDIVGEQSFGPFASYPEAHAFATQKRIAPYRISEDTWEYRHLWCEIVDLWREVAAEIQRKEQEGLS